MALLLCGDIRRIRNQRGFCVWLLYLLRLVDLYIEINGNIVWPGFSSAGIQGGHMGLAGLQISLAFAIGQAMPFKKQRMVVCAEHVRLKAPHVSIATGILLPIGAALVHAS